MKFTKGALNKRHFEVKEIILTPHAYGVETLPVQRFNKTESENVLDHIVQEYPIALVYNGISHAVMMATPTDVDLFAKGFSLGRNFNQLKRAIYP